MAAAKSRRRAGRIVLAFVAAALLLLILLWDWNWFRPMIEKQAGNVLGRQVTVGNFDVDLGLHPTIALDQIAVANPPEFPEDTRLGGVEHFAVTVDPWQYFHGRIALLNIDIIKPWGDLKPGPSGKPNYRFEKLEQPADQAQPEPGKDGGEGPELVIGRLNVQDGEVHILEPRFKTDFRLKIHTRNNADGQPRIHVDAEGTYSGQPITGRFVGGSLLSLREDGTRYPVQLRVKNGATEVVLIGSVDDPLKLRGANLKLDFRGDNLADLYPLTGVPLQPSPPFSLNGTFDYRKNKFRFDDFIGKVGGSDLGGDVAVDPAGPRKRLITMRLRSRKVALADLSGFLGGDGGKGTGSDDTAQHKDDSGSGDRTGGKVLPDKPFSVPRLQAVNMDVTYKAARIESDKVPVDNLDAHLIIDEGRVKLEPLKFAVGDGTIAINVRLDTNEQPIHTVADVDFRELDFSRIMNKTSAFEGSGKVGGSAKLDARGNSVAQMLASGDGEMKLFMAGGDVSALLVDLAGLDFGNSLLSALGIPSRAQLRCFVGDFALQDGLVDTRMLLADTSEANLVGDGTVNLRDETIDYALETQPKSLSAAALSAPIEIGGTLGEPQIMPNLKVLGAKGGAAVVLGTVMAPLAALIPTIQLGLGRDNDCEKLLREAGTAGAPNRPPSSRGDAAAGRPQSQ